MKTVGPLSGERNEQGSTCFGPSFVRCYERLRGAVLGGLYTSVLETISLLCSPVLPLRGRTALEPLVVGLKGPIPTP